MRSFIFITNEGYTFQPGSEAVEPVENCQVIGFADGASPEDAFKNLLKENEFLLMTSFNEVIGIEVKGKSENFFYLNDIKNCSNL